MAQEGPVKIAFLAPAGAMHRYHGSFGIGVHYAPLTLTTLAALVPEELGAELVIHDETAGAIPLDCDADLICITAITGTAARAYAYADWFRSQGRTVVLGGVHPTMLPDEAQQHADAVVTGFAEQTFPRLCRDFAAGQLQPRYVQNADYTIVGRPTPRRDLLNKHRYITTNTVEVVRGCALGCTFCAYPTAFGSTVHKRPVAEIIAEIEALPGKYVAIPDINLLTGRVWTTEFFTALAPLKKKWMGLVTSAIGSDDEMIKLFERSGCQGLLIGFESINEESQKFFHKRVNKVGGYPVLMKKLHDAGIAVQGCFAFGGDDEDTSVFERTIEMVSETKMDLPRYSILTPFPNTAYHHQLEAEGRIIEREWPMYDVEHVVYEPKKMTPDELYAGITWAWDETYKLSAIAKRLAPFDRAPLVSGITNLFGYRGYAKKFTQFPRERMVDNSDIPAPDLVPPGAPREGTAPGSRQLRVLQ
jgi:radical SAM superfamily enzyme YgiQ (UPF0313 family)